MNADELSNRLKNLTDAELAQFAKAFLEIFLATGNSPCFGYLRLLPRWPRYM